jgi:two-component system chemotaxis response regulator CheB
VPNIIVIGASAGGVQALREVISPLPANFQAALFVVMHVSAESPSALPSILNSVGALKAEHPEDGEEIMPSRIYVALPDHHMLIEPGKIRITHGPRENRHRPAIDPLFRTAARSYGQRVLGIVLSGNLEDGTVGLHIVKSEGGTTIVQDPNNALFPGMPRSALRAVKPDFVLNVDAIAPKILELVREPWKEKLTAAKPGVRTPEGEKMSEAKDPRVNGTPSVFTCPDCNGTLWELQEGDLLMYRCRVGHAYSEDGMHNGYSDSVEAALWSAVRSLVESAQLERRLADQATLRKDPVTADRFSDIARDREVQASTIRNMLLSSEKSRMILPF